MNPTIIGFIKQLGGVVLFALLTYLGDASHFNGVVSPVIAAIITALVASYESYLKAKSNNTTALFGSVYVK